MDSKDFKNVCTAASGVALTAAGMYASGMSSALDLSMDATQVAAAVAAGIITGGMGVALLGLAPLALKYGYKFCQLIKEKFRGKNYELENVTDKVSQHTLSNESSSNVSSRGNTKEGNISTVMKKGYNRGAPINNASRRSARNPTPRSRTISKEAVSAVQSNYVNG